MLKTTHSAAPPMSAEVMSRATVNEAIRFLRRKNKTRQPAADWRSSLPLLVNSCALSKSPAARTALLGSVVASAMDMMGYLPDE